jgi:periplasmic copper chaperone A
MATFRNRALVALLLAGVSAAAHAQVTVAGAWARGTVAGQGATGAYMTLEAQTATALVEAASPIAKVVEIHEMALDAGVMKMRALDRVDLPAGKIVELKPGGRHVMLMGLSRQLRDGDAFPLTLTFADRAGKRHRIDVTVSVKPLAPAPK